MNLSNSKKSTCPKLLFVEFFNDDVVAVLMLILLLLFRTKPNVDDTIVVFDNINFNVVVVVLMLKPL